MSRFQKFVFLLSTLCASIFISAIAHADVEIAELRDMRADAAEASKANSLMLVIATVGDCVYCEVVKEEFLKPLMASGELDGVAIVRELPLDGLDITDLEGRMVEPVDIGNRYGARFSPTVFFLSPDGKVLHEPIVGLQSRDFYGFYLEKAIAKAKRKLNADS